MSVQGELFGKAKKPSKVPPQVEEIVAGGFDARKFVENFEVLAEAAGGVVKLRQFILTLAVSGRLICQSATDADAGTLLSQIASAQSNRGKGVQEGDLSQPEGPFEIPRGWRWARFIDVASIDSHLVNPSDFPTYLHLAPDNVEKRTGRLLECRTVREDGVTSNKHRFFPGQLVYSKIRPNLSKCVIVDFEGLCSADMYPIGARIEREYLHVFMLSEAFLEQVVREDNRLAMPKVNQEQLGATLVSVPPLAEQKRIVAKVDELMALCDDLEARQAKKRETGARLTKSALEALTTAEGPEQFEVAWKRVVENFEVLFSQSSGIVALRDLALELAFRGSLVAEIRGDTSAHRRLEQVEAAWVGRRRKEPLPEVGAGERPASPERWGWVRLGNLAETVGGVTKGRDLRGRKLNSYPYLRVANVQRGYLDLATMKEIEIPEDELEKYRLAPGDILFTEGGDWDKLGRSSVWRGEIDPCIHQNHVFRARVVADLDPAWFSLFANSPVGRRYFENAAKQTTNLASINMTQLRNCPVPLPPLKEQRCIVAKLEQMMKVCDELETKLLRAEDRAAKLVEAVVREMVA